MAVFIRTDKEVARIANYNPFGQSKFGKAAELNVIFLARTLDAALKQKVKVLKTETDEFHVHGHEIYWLRRKKRGKSIFSTVPLDKALGRSFTIRLVKTLRRLAMKLSSVDECYSS